MNSHFQTLFACLNSHDKFCLALGCTKVDLKADKEGEKITLQIFVLIYEEQIFQIL